MYLCSVQLEKNNEIYACLLATTRCVEQRKPFFSVVATEIEHLLSVRRSALDRQTSSKKKVRTSQLISTRDQVIR